jgi:hypothetical protein
MKRLIRRWILVVGAFRVVEEISFQNRKIGSLRRKTEPTSISCGGLQSDRAMRVDG